MATVVNRDAEPLASETDLCEFCKFIKFEAVGFHKSESSRGHLFHYTRSLREVLQNSKDLKDNSKDSKDNPKCTFCREVAESFSEWSRRKFATQVLDLQNDSNRAHYTMGSLDSHRDHYTMGSLDSHRAHYTMGSLDSHRAHYTMGSLDSHRAHYTMGSLDSHLIRLQVTLKVLSPERVAHGLVLEFQKCSQDPQRSVEDFCKRGSLSDWGIERKQAYSGRIRPLNAETELFSKWISTCRDEHRNPHCGERTNGDEEERLTFMGLDGLRLIDVKEMCVVDAKGYMNYTALSYVWGEYKLKQNEKVMPRLSTENRFRFQEPGSLSPDMLPKTIRDAIELTKRLGYQYIWIDCLCIVQDDEIDQRYFIPQVEVIFRCAVFTIIAASGDNADAGLPGIRSNSRTRKQKPFTIKGVSLVRTLDPERSEERYSSFFGYLKGSEWGNRGWTFQEKLLSPRALIFTVEQVYWECQTSTWCEDGLWETMESPTVYRHCFGDKDYRHPWEDIVERRYGKIVQEFSGRTLKYEKDRRDAFEGIIGRFQWDAKRTHIFLWALPKRFLINALMWHCKKSSPRRRQEKCRVTSEWGQPIKDCPFPSWSWLGWEGKVCFNDSQGGLVAKTIDLLFYYFSGGKLLNANQPRATESLVDMYVRKKDDRTTVSLEDIPKSIDRDLVVEVHQSNVLFFWSSTAKLYVHRRGLYDQRRGRHLRHHGDCTWLDSHGNDELILTKSFHYYKDMPADSKDVMPAKFWQTPSQFPPDHADLVDFVVIGKFVEGVGDRVEEGAAMKEETERDKNLLAVLLVSWKNGIAYREGLVSIQLSDWVALENRVWKLIFLG